jgi:hypothetical protein
VRVVGTLESFQSFLNREMTAEICLLELQTLYIDLVSSNRRTRIGTYLNSLMLNGS